jgi:hypothetical protein
MQALRQVHWRSQGAEGSMERAASNHSQDAGRRFSHSADGGDAPQAWWQRWLESGEEPEWAGWKPCSLPHAMRAGGRGSDTAACDQERDGATQSTPVATPCGAPRSHLSDAQPRVQGCFKRRMAERR